MMAGYRNVYIEGDEWRESLTLPVQLSLWPFSPYYSPPHVHNSKGLGWHLPEISPWLAKLSSAF